MSGKPIVLAIDDEPKILEIVKSYLEKSGYFALTAENGREAMEKLRQHPVSLILLDLMLPDISGEELCRQIRAYSGVPIIMMTAKTEEEHIVHGLSIGADDYVTKPFSPRQLMARVAAVLRRTTLTVEKPGENSAVSKANGMYRYDTLAVDTESKRATKGDQLLALTPNEYRILALLISRPQKIFTRDEIIDAIKNDDYDGFDRSIDVHVSNLRQKIEDDPKNPRFVKTAYGMGYRFGGEA
ncbi:MAG: response regulator transcription factor [Treponema sp.]|jgi:DNA-binding response OmpR family regulator|nr:response regulator transcription factor [Treponema sp.]